MKPYNRSAAIVRIQRDTKALNAEYQRAWKNFFTLSNVLGAVCAHFKIEPDDLQHRSNAPRYTWPRFMAIYLLTEHTTYNRTQIARTFNRTPTAVLHDLAAFQRWIATHRKAAREFAAVNALFRRISL